MRIATALLLGLLAVLFTLLNAFKPLLIDDTAYHAYAAQLARHPLDPYGFRIFWYQHPEPANEVLAPPVLPYWWSLAIRLFGEDPFLWKLWLFPFSLLFVVSLYQLLRRFACGVEMPLLWMTVLSPTFLPSLSLMLDVPALALSLCALVLFLRAVDRDSVFLAVLSGGVAALAVQTKYTGLLAPATMFLHAVLFRKLRLWSITAGITVVLFVSWEGWIALRGYGQSHFVFHFLDNQSTFDDKVRLVLPLLTILGGITPPLLLLGLTARGWSLPTILAVGEGLAVGYALVAFVPDAYTTITTDPESGQERLTLNNLLFGTFGLGLIGITGDVIRQLFRTWQPREEEVGVVQSPVEWFLVLWLGLEVAGYIALSPFTAVRRVMGVVVVLALLLGRLASRTCQSAERRRLVHGVAVAGIVLGLGFFAVNFCDARAEQQAAERAAAWIQEQQATPGATAWYVGHWGFQFYAERAGMKAVEPERSLLRKNDWLVVPDHHHSQQLIEIDARSNREVQTIRVSDGASLRTVMCYFGGRTPLEHHERPRVLVTIYRVVADYCPPAPR